MPLSREQKLGHILAAISASGAKGAARAALETWIQGTFRSSGQATYIYLKDLRTRRWVREAGSRYWLTDDGETILTEFREREIGISVQTQPFVTPAP